MVYFCVFRHWISFLCRFFGGDLNVCVCMIFLAEKKNKKPRCKENPSSSVFLTHFISGDRIQSNKVLPFESERRLGL